MNRLAGAALILVPSFLVVVGLAELAIEAWDVRQAFAVNAGIIILLGVAGAAWHWGERVFALAMRALGRGRSH